MLYYGTRLTENISRREPEGYLLCLNVPVARTGIQEYLPGELSPPGSLPLPAALPVPVLRPESEVFAPETLASFEGMPVTNDHPPAGVTAENIRAYQKGHAHNVRRGAGKESDLLLADLIITDPGLIAAVLAGKREISCGYTYDLCEENGRYVQRRIRGNHVAVVDVGRAGPRVSIRDARPSRPCPPHPLQIAERSKTPMKKTVLQKSLLKKLACMARDGDPEAIEALAESVEEILENPSPAPETVTVIAAAGEPAAPAEPVPAEAAAAEALPAEVPPAEGAPAADEDILSAILERLDRLVALLPPAAPAADDDPVPTPEQVSEILEEVIEGAEPAGEIASLVREIVEPGAPQPADTVDDGEEETEARSSTLEAGDALRAALQAVRPALKTMSRRERSRVCADIASRLKATAADSGVYAALASAARRPAANPADLGKRIMASRSANRPRT